MAAENGETQEGAPAVAAGNGETQEGAPAVAAENDETQENAPAAVAENGEVLEDTPAAAAENGDIAQAAGQEPAPPRRRQTAAEYREAAQKAAYERRKPSPNAIQKMNALRQTVEEAEKAMGDQKLHPFRRWKVRLQRRQVMVGAGRWLVRGSTHVAGDHLIFFNELKWHWRSVYDIFYYSTSARNHLLPNWPAQ